MKNTCKNCKYWDLENVKSVKNRTIRECKKVKMFWDATEWTEEEDEDLNCVRSLREENKNDKAFVQDGSDYMAELLTRDDFGCNQFEPIE